MSKPNKPSAPEVTEAPAAPAETPAAAPAEAGAAAPAAAKKAGGGVAIVLANGMKRAEYIRQEFAKGRKRGEIAKELNVAYQIVFAATKGLSQPATVAPASEAPAAAEAPAAS